MKKIFTLAIVAMFSLGVMAQHEIGAIVGGMNGLSYKYWLSSNIAVQTDLAVGLTAAYAGMYSNGTKLVEGQMDHYDFMLNPNLLYHIDLPADFKVYFGGGVGIGLLGDLNGAPVGSKTDVIGKFLVNGTVGAAYSFSGVPLVMALDFRPGYGLGFEDSSMPHYSMFDWKLGLSLRYVL